MAKVIKPKLMKGLRDFLPRDMIKRDYVINKIKQVFRRFGFTALETPTIEMYKTLAGKYGDDGEKLIYRFKDRGDRDLGLRYDLTIPLSRVVAMHQNDLLMPMKRFQIQPVWRADKPGRGRYREFYQCDVDVVGSRDLIADAEVITCAHDIMSELGFKNFKMKINSRKILRGIVEISETDVNKEADVCRAIDKLDKIGYEGVEKELLERGISEDAKNTIIEIIRINGSVEEVIRITRERLKDSETALKGIDEMETLKGHFEAMGVDLDRIDFDISLARGLDYYTGPIYESVVEEPKIGSLGGGGRYDALIGMFLGQEIPAVGYSIGLERIITVMDELNMYPDNLTFGIDVLICRVGGEDRDYNLKLATKLRRAGLNAEIYLGKSKKGLRAQLGYADDKMIPVTLIAGGDEIEKGVITVKDMKKGEQLEIPQDEVVEKIREITGKK